MTSSDGRRPAGKSGTTAGTRSEAGAPADEPADGDQPDPWFAPGPKRAEGSDAASSGWSTGHPGTDDWRTGGAGGGALEPDTAQWFLQAGRAGLLPESMTVASGETEAAEHAPLAPVQAAASGAPPWAGEAAGRQAGSPPPWENGPWPGPGSQRRFRAAASAQLAASALPPAGPGAGPARGSPWPARTVLIAGLVPLVIPGLVAGALTVRKSRPGGPERRAGFLALAASVGWAVLIVVVVLAFSGGSAAACTYPSGVHQAYARALADLSGHAAAPVQAAALSVAVSRANATAAGTSELPVRTALFKLAGDLELARGDLTAHRRVPATLLRQLAADGTALDQACPS